jgi:predicted ArsR family transcriptional regulator
VTLPRPSDDPAVRRARAVGSDTRRAILAELERADGGLDVRRLADRTHLHPNAVRQHLAVLRDAGLVTEAVERAHGAGRPPTIYRAASAISVDPFERLAALLVDVAAGRDVAAVGADEGVRLTAELHDAVDPADALAHAAATHGFTVRVDRGADATRVALEGCPYASLAGPVVCALHRAVAEGAATAAGGRVTGYHIVDPRVANCEVVLAPPPEGATP